MCVYIYIYIYIYIYVCKPVADCNTFSMNFGMQLALRVIGFYLSNHLRSTALRVSFEIH